MSCKHNSFQQMYMLKMETNLHLDKSKMQGIFLSDHYIKWRFDNFKCQNKKVISNT